MYVVPSGFTPPTINGYTGNHPLIGYRNLVAGGGITVETEEAEYPGSNLTNPSTASLWRAADTTDQFITLSIGGEMVDYVAVARHNWGSAAIPVSLLIDVGGSPVSFAIIIPEFTPDDDLPLIFRFPPMAVQTIQIRLNTGGTAPAEAAVIYAGELLVLPRIWAGHTPLPDGIITEQATGMSESGNFLGRIITGESRASNIHLPDLDADWFRANLRPFLRGAHEEPFFFAWRPERYPAETGFAWLTNQPRPVNQQGGTGLVAVDLELGGIA